MPQATVSPANSSIARILVLGVGGAGCNIIWSLVDEGFNSAPCVAVNTDRYQLDISHANEKLLIGERAAGGHGAAGKPELGLRSAEEATEQLRAILEGFDVVFILAGLGGGTGTGAAPWIARLARFNKALVIGIAIFPFNYERDRLPVARSGLEQLKRFCDSVLVVNNNRWADMISTTPLGAHVLPADETCMQIVRSLVQFLASPSLTGTNFERFKEMIKEGEVAHFGLGEARSANRAESAAMAAIRSSLPYADFASSSGAIIHVAGDETLSLTETSSVLEFVADSINPNAPIVWSASVNPSSNGILRVAVFLTGKELPYVPGAYRRLPIDLYEMEPESAEEQRIHFEMELDQLENF